MEKLGVALVNVSMGSPYTTPHVLRPFEVPPPDGYETPEHPLKGVERHFTLTGELQRRFPGLPMVGSGVTDYLAAPRNPGLFEVPVDSGPSPERAPALVAITSSARALPRSRAPRIRSDSPLP